MTFFADSCSSTPSLTRAWQAWRFLSAMRRRRRFRLGGIPNASKKRSSRAREYALPERNRPFARSMRYGRSGCGLSGFSEKMPGNHSSERSRTVSPLLAASRRLLTRDASALDNGIALLAGVAAATEPAWAAAGEGLACADCPLTAKRPATARALPRAPRLRVTRVPLGAGSPESFSSTGRSLGPWSARFKPEPL